MALLGVGAFLLATVVKAANYEEYILAPTSRTLHPATVYQVNGSVSDAASLTGDSSGTAKFNGKAAVTYDFGKVSCRHLVILHAGFDRL
jgi:hypothetical protein